MLMRPESQIKSYIEDALRSVSSRPWLSKFIWEKRWIVLKFKKHVAEENGTYGYIIVKPWTLKLSQMSKWNQSMNEITAQKKTRQLRNCEAGRRSRSLPLPVEAEKNRLHRGRLPSNGRLLVDADRWLIEELYGFDLTESNRVYSVNLTSTDTQTILQIWRNNTILPTS